MLLETEGGIWARADAAVFRLLMNDDRTGRRLQAANRTVANAHRRVATLRRRIEATDARAHAKAAREVEREFAVSWGKTMRVRVPRTLTPTGAKAEPGRSVGTRAVHKSSASRRAIRACAPLLDARGRIALYFRIRYVGFKSKTWRPGLAADHALYILREAALENGDIDLDFAPLSNMGRNAEEIAACWRVLETMEEGYRANAKVQYRIVWNLPHGLDSEQRRDLVEEFCERSFGRLGLPWVAAVHAPDPRGDQRNYHAHVCFSTRPCERTGDHEWAIAQEKINGLTDADGLKLMRALAAGHMNTACRAADLPVRFTHQTYKERGIDAERQDHVGPAAMAAHERGEAVAVIERNALIVERNELAATRDALAHEAALSDRLITALAAGLDLATQRQRIDAVRSQIQHVAVAAKVIAANVGTAARRSGIAAQRATARRIGNDARRVMARIAARPTAPSSSVKAVVRSVAAAAQRHGTHRQEADRHRQSLAPLRDRLDASRRVVAAHQAQETEDQRKAACDRLRYAPVRPYVIVGGTVTLDLSAMLKDDVALVRTLDRDTMIAALRERIRRDREQDAAEARVRERAAADSCTAEHRHQRLIKDEAVALRARAERDDAAAAAALDAMLKMIEDERVLVGFDGDLCVVDTAVTRRFGIALGAITAVGVQKRLDAIADRQRAEIERLGIHVATHAGDVVHESGGWTLSATAPVGLRRIADAWRHEPALQKALADTAAAHSTTKQKKVATSAPRSAPASTPANAPVEAAKVTASLPAPRPFRQRLLVLAAEQRMARTKRWEQSRRYDSVHADVGWAAEPVVQQQSSPLSSGPARRLLPLDPGQGR